MPQVVKTLEAAMAPVIAHDPEIQFAALDLPGAVAGQ